jgi:D-alanyl-D-alanine dipeptidase
MAALLSTQVVAAPPSLPDGFVYLDTLAPKVRQEMHYAGSDNFVGRPLAGYLAARCILTQQAATRLARIENELSAKGLGLRIFDCYRPQRAVNDLLQWSKDPSDQINKTRYYPQVPKDQLFARGYIIEKSGHTRGSTVDLTVEVRTPGAAVPGKIKPNGELDMGTAFDWFGEASHTDNPNQPVDVRANRRWFTDLMARHGFRNLPEEWWHYTLVDEPFPDTYFDFPVR